MTRFETPLFYQKFLYWISKTFCYLAFKIFWRLDVRGDENVPASGGCLLAANHVSLADPPLIGGTLKRVIYFFAKEELFRIPLFGWYLHQLNAFPVKRYEHDVGAFKHAQVLLLNGQAVVLFPEGRRSKTGEIGKVKAGVGMLAYKTKVPVVPVYIANTNHLKRFKRIKIEFGPPLFPPEVDNEKDAYQIFSNRVMEAIIRLKTRSG